MSFPVNSMVIFYGHVSHYQRVDGGFPCPGSLSALADVISAKAGCMGWIGLESRQYIIE